MTKINLCNEVLENAIGVHRSLEEIEPLEIMDAVAVQAMEELLEYRAIGTVDDYWKLNEICKEYSAIGTIEEFNALKEKNTPYKPQEYEDKYYGCKCGEVLLEKWEVYPTKMMHKSWGLPYCLGCGQKLDWQ